MSSGSGCLNNVFTCWSRSVYLNGKQTHLYIYTSVHVVEMIANTHLLQVEPNIFSLVKCIRLEGASFWWLSQI